MRVLQATKMRAAAVGVVLVTAISGWGGAEPAITETSDTEAALTDCQFSIRASNNLSFDVWVMLYDSSVLLPDRFSFGPYTPTHKFLRIQNHRIRSGGKMDRRYTAKGKCSAKRIWLFQVVRGAPGKAPHKTVEIETGGNWSGARTVDLGPSSQWDPIN